MASVLREIEQQKQLIVEDYYQQSLLTNKYMKRDHNCTMKIQRIWRMHVVRKKFIRKKEAGLTIQRYIRGYLAWKKVNKMKFKRQEKQNIKFFDYHAILIQKVFRGYHYRRYTNDHYKRKEALKEIRKRDLEVKALGDEYKEQCINELKRETYEKAKNKYDNLAKDMHHLVSTKHINGVYNPPYADKPIVFDKDYESHIKDIFKKNYKWQPPNRETVDYFKSKIDELNGTRTRATNV